MDGTICHIAGAGEFHAKNFRGVLHGDMVIAADGGLKWLEQAGIVPDMIVGDFDSYPIPANKGTKIIPLNREKDETDMRRAIAEGLKKGFRTFHIHGGTGGRADHTLANIQCIVNISRKNAYGILYFENYFLTAITNGEITLQGSGYVSVFAYSGAAYGVTLAGLKYEISGATLHDDNPIGTSNEFTEREARISVASGTLLITCPNTAKVVKNVR